MSTANPLSLLGQRVAVTATSQLKRGSGVKKPENSPLTTKTFLPRRDILLGIETSTKMNDGLKGRSCTLYQRSSSETMSGSDHTPDHAHKMAAVEVPSPPSQHHPKRADPKKWEGLTKQQLEWLERQEIKPGHFTDAYIHNLGSTARPLFSLRKIEVKERESRLKALSTVQERQRKTNVDRKKNFTSDSSSKQSSQRSSSHRLETPAGVKQPGLQYLPDGSPVINIPHGRIGEHPVVENQTELDKLKSELQSQNKGQSGMDQDTGKSAKKKPGSKSSSAAFTKSPSRKSTPAKSKAKKPPSGTSSVQTKQTKTVRAKTTTSKVKRKKTSRKMSEKEEGTEVPGQIREENMRVDSILPQKSDLTGVRPGTTDDIMETGGTDRLRVIGTPVDTEMTDWSSRTTVTSVGVLEDRRSQASNAMDGRRISRADERRMEVERKRAEKRRLQQEQQQQEEERLRLQAEVEKAREEAAMLMNSNEILVGTDLNSPESSVEIDEEARQREELERLKALQGMEENVPRLTEEELERLMKERELNKEAERLRMEGERLRQEEERLRREEERIERLKRKQEAEESRKQEEARKAQEEMMRWKKELESVKRESAIQESIAHLQSEIELAKLDALNAKRYDGTVLREPTYFSYFRYCPKLYEGPPKPKTERGKRGKRPQSTLSK